MAKRVVIIGAGPAGLTAAYELLSRSDDYEVVILEKAKKVGGIARSVDCNGNIMDVGGHRFLTDVPEINNWWKEMLPTVLEQERLSRIYFNQKFYDYPVKLRMETIKNMGIGTTFVVCGSFLKSKFLKRRVESLEDYYIKQFGKKMYQMFFENYTENLWGRHPRDISPEYGMQRVNDKISVIGLLKDMIIGDSAVEDKKKDVFLYPELGPGQMWETVANKVRDMGGKIVLGAEVVGIKRSKKNEVKSVVYKLGEKKRLLKSDYVLSSMPMKDLVMVMDDVPRKYLKIAKELPYRDYMIIGVLVSKLVNAVPDDWVYIHDKNVKMGRVQIYNNWSPSLVRDAEHTVWLGLEYFCNEGDELWRMTDKKFAEMAILELKKIKLIDDNEKILDFHIEREKKAYPAYFGSYPQIDELRCYLDKIPNLFLVGRNGQHRYNNMDHSMMAAIEAVKNILSGSAEKDNIWNVNASKEHQ